MARWTAAIAMLALRGCGAAHVPQISHVELDGAPITEPLSSPITFGPIAHTASSYDEPFAATTSDPLADAIFAGLQTSAARDARLDIACAELAGVVPQGATSSDELVEFALRAHGVVEHGRPFVAHGKTAAEIVAALAPQLADPLRFSNARIGIGGSDPVVVIVTYTSPVTFTAAPREVHGGVELAATLAAPFHDPHVTVTYNDRSIEQLAVTVDGADVHASFACNGHAGTQWLAVAAADEPRPLSVVPISCGSPPPSTFRVEPDANLATHDAERRLIAIVNRERAAAHLALLRTDPRATQAAQRYAETMRSAKDVAHDLEHTTPAARLRAVGRVPLFLSESTLQAGGLGRATEILLNDPLYRAEVESPIVTHVGIGIAPTREGELYIAIEYVQIPAAIDAARVTRSFEDQIQHAGRTKRTAGPRMRRGRRETTGAPDVDDDLSKIARDAAADLAIGRRTESEIKRQMSEESRRYGGLGLQIRHVADPDQFDVGTLVPEGTLVDNIGVGVVQSDRDGPLSGWIWIVVILGHY